MIVPYKILREKRRYDKRLNLMEAKQKLERLNLYCDEDSICDYFALLATCLEKGGFRDFELNLYLSEIRDSKNIKIFINEKISEFFEKNFNNTDFTMIKEYVKKEIFPYYRYKFRINHSRELSFLPLELRLYVYNELLQLEDGGVTSLHYLDRIYITLSKLGQKKLASIIMGHKWVLNWGNLIGGNTDEILQKEFHFILNAKDIRKKILKKDGLTPDKYLEEVLYSLSSFANLENIHDKKVAVLLLPILNMYYNKFPNIDTYIDDLREYILSEDEKYIVQIREALHSRKNYKQAKK